MVASSTPEAFRALSARLGADPLQIQRPGGNTSIKRDGTMWIKASGTELADALTQDIFVAVDVEAARAEIDGAGDGTCRAAMLDRDSKIRPSIETTFHALFEHAVVAHTHSVAVLAHVTSDAGTEAALDKLEGLAPVAVPYRKPGLPLTLAIRDAISTDTTIVLLRNHGLIVASVDPVEVDATIRGVEDRLGLEPKSHEPKLVKAPEGWRAVIGTEGLGRREATGSFWPDHVVFLGPAVAPDVASARAEQMAALHEGGAVVRSEARPIADTMLRCLADVAIRVPDGWTMQPIGPDAEAELMNWDAEAYRQKLAGPS